MQATMGAAAPLCPEQWHSTFQLSAEPEKGAAAPAWLSMGLCTFACVGKASGDAGLQHGL